MKEDVHRLRRWLNEFADIAANYSDQGSSDAPFNEARQKIIDLYSQAVQDTEDVYHDFCVSVFMDNTLLEMLAQNNVEVDMKMLREDAEAHLIEEAAPGLKARIAQYRHDRYLLEKLKEREQQWLNLNMLYRQHILQLTNSLHANGCAVDTKHTSHIKHFQDQLNVGPCLLRREPANE